MIDDEYQDVLTLLRETPLTVLKSEVEDLENLYFRTSMADLMVIDAIGYGEGFVQWVGDLKAPSDEERLLWIWVIHPSKLERLLSYARARGWRDATAWLLELKSAED